MTRIALVPGALALLPEYASLKDPVADLRKHCLEAVAWLGSDVSVLADAQGARVADALLNQASWSGEPGLVAEPAYLVVANGSAKRSEKAPGFLDPRAFTFDAVLGAALGVRDGHPNLAVLAELDRDLAAELWASVDAVPELARLLGDGHAHTVVDYADDPYDVQYWVLRWEV